MNDKFIMANKGLDRMEDFFRLLGLKLELSAHESPYTKSSSYAYLGVSCACTKEAAHKKSAKHTAKKVLPDAFIF